MFSDISNAGHRRREAFVTVDPIKFFATIGSSISALLLLIFICVLTPANSQGFWPATWVGGWTLMFFAPLAALLWAVTVPPSWEMGTYKWTRRLIQLHASIAALTMLGGCAIRQEVVLHGLVAFGALFIDLVILFWSPWMSFDQEDVHTYRTFQLRLAGGAVAAIAIWSFSNIGLVVWQAQYISDGRPYCLEVAGRGYGYNQTTSLLDLNGLRLRATSGKHDEPVGFHAVLVIDTGDGSEWRNWSYLFQHFALIAQSPVVRSRIRPSCHPRMNFALQLPIW
jgi:hypothetical protein